MAVTLNATPGAAGANSYATVARAQQYFDMRTPVAGWDDAESQDVLLMMATRLIDASLSPRRTFVPPAGGGKGGYYVNRPTWTGSRAAGNASRLAWTRSGMYDRNGIVIPENVFPEELADATAELAGALGTKDTTLDNDLVIQGITALKAGPVSLSFSDAVLSKPLPESVLDLLVPSWLTLQSIDSLYDAFIAVVSS